MVLETCISKPGKGQITWSEFKKMVDEGLEMGGFDGDDVVVQSIEVNRTDSRSINVYCHHGDFIDEVDFQHWDDDWVAIHD